MQIHIFRQWKSFGIHQKGIYLFLVVGKLFTNQDFPFSKFLHCGNGIKLTSGGLEGRRVKGQQVKGHKSRSI